MPVQIGISHRFRLFVTFDTSSTAGVAATSTPALPLSPLGRLNTEDAAIIRGKECAAEGRRYAEDGADGGAPGSGGSHDEGRLARPGGGSDGGASAAEDTDIDALFDSLQNAVISALLEPDP